MEDHNQFNMPPPAAPAPPPPSIDSKDYHREFELLNIKIDKLTQLVEQLLQAQPKEEPKKEHSLW